MSRIRIGPVFYEVIIKPAEDMKADNGDMLLRQKHNDTMEIWLSEQHTHESKFLTLWHEALHSFADTYGVSLSESKVEALSSGISQMLQDNPELNWVIYDAAKQNAEIEEVNMAVLLYNGA